MKRVSWITVLVLSACLIGASSALAHGDQPRLEISADSLHPGDLLEIRGVDFEFEEEVTLFLIGMDNEVPLGVVTGDTEGIFQSSFQLPVDLAIGIYSVHATTDDHVVASPPINVWGNADLGGGEQGGMEEGDSLLAPMPSRIPATSLPAPLIESSEGVQAQNSGSSLVWILLTVGVILMVAIFRVVRK